MTAPARDPGWPGVVIGLLVAISAAFASIAFIIDGLLFAAARGLLAPLRRRHGRHRGRRRERIAAIDAEADEAVAYFRQDALPVDPVLRDAGRILMTLDPGGSPVPPDAAAEPSPLARAATLPQPPCGDFPPSSPGLGQHPFDGHRERQPWVIRHEPPTGSFLAIGYGPFDTGPRALITDSRISLRRTGAHAALDAGPRLVPGYYAAHEARRGWTL